jgi:transcriptional regulator with XRE-family HTH domain
MFLSMVLDTIDGISRIRHTASVMITPAQCRAARGLLDWTQQDLADHAGIGIVTVRHFEAGVNEPRRATLEVVKRAFEAAGIEFIAPNDGGVGLRLKSSGSRDHQ